MKRSSSSGMGSGTSTSSASSSGGEVKCCMSVEVGRRPVEEVRVLCELATVTGGIGECGVEGADPPAVAAGRSTGLASRRGTDSLRLTGPESTYNNGNQHYDRFS
jgi:hypothetical protein